MGDTYPTQELLGMLKELKDYFTSEAVQTEKNEMTMVDKLDFLSATEKSGLLGKFSALNSVFNPAGSQPEKASFVAQCKVCISGMIVFVGEKIPTDARDRSAIEFIQFLMKFWLALDASAGAAAPAPLAEAAVSAPPAEATVASNADMWRCIHRLASVLEGVQFGAKYPDTEDSEQGVMMRFVKTDIIEPALDLFVGPYKRQGRLSHGWYHMSYQLKDGWTPPEQIIQVIYDYDAKAIRGEVMYGPVIFTIKTGALQSNESRQFLNTCIEKLIEFMNSAQKHFDQYGTMKRFRETDTLR